MKGNNHPVISPEFWRDYRQAAIIIGGGIFALAALFIIMSAAIGTGDAIYEAITGKV